MTRLLYGFEDFVERGFALLFTLDLFFLALDGGWCTLFKLGFSQFPRCTGRRFRWGRCGAGEGARLGGHGVGLSFLAWGWMCLKGRLWMGRSEYVNNSSGRERGRDNKLVKLQRVRGKERTRRKTGRAKREEYQNCLRYEKR